MTKRQRRQFDAAIDAAIAVAHREALVRTKQRLNAAIAVALREALASTARKLARIKGAFTGTIGVKYVWIKRRSVPRHTVRRHQRLVLYKLPEAP